MGVSRQVNYYWFYGGEHALSVFAVMLRYSLWCLSVPKTCEREGVGTTSVIKRWLEQAFCSRIRHSFISERTETLGPRFKTSILRPNCAIQERRGKKVLINNEKMISMHQYEAGQDRRYEASGHQITLSHHRAAQTRPRLNLTLTRKMFVSVVGGDARKAQNENGRAAAVWDNMPFASPHGAGFSGSRLLMLQVLFWLNLPKLIRHLQWVISQELLNVFQIGATC